MRFHERLEEQDLRQWVRSFDVEATHLEEDTDPVTRVRLNLVHPHAEAMCFLAAAFLVEQVDQCPACFRDDGVKLEGSLPAFLGEVVTLFLVVGFALEELDTGCLPWRARPDGVKVFEG
jgi:hypothetical protein